MKLLLDLKNKPGKLNKLPFGKLPIGLLAHDKKAAKQAAHYSRHSKQTDWLRLPEKQQTAAIVKYLRKLLKTEPQSQLVIVSRRSKLRKACRDLCAEFPDANITLWKRCGKKCRQFLEKMQADQRKQHRSKKNKAVSQNDESITAQPLLDNTLFQATVTRIENAISHVLQQEQDLATIPADTIEATAATEDSTQPENNGKTTFATLIPTVQQAVTAVADSDGWANLNDVIEHLAPNIHPNEYGFDTHHDLIHSIYRDWLKIKKTGHGERVRINRRFVVRKKQKTKAGNRKGKA